MKRFVLNGSERAHGQLFHRSVFPNATCFTSCAVRCGGRAAIGGGNGTQVNIPVYLLARTSGENLTATSLRLPFQENAHIMDIDFKIFDSDGLITEVEQRPSLYN